MLFKNISTSTLTNWANGNISTRFRFLQSFGQLVSFSATRPFLRIDHVPFALRRKAETVSHEEKASLGRFRSRDNPIDDFLDEYFILLAINFGIQRLKIELMTSLKKDNTHNNRAKRIGMLTQCSNRKTRSTANTVWTDRSP